MTDAQDTIELPAFGLTLTRIAVDGWFGADRGQDYVHANEVGFVRLARARPSGTLVSYYKRAETVDDACAALLAEMTPDDVAAIRALGERS